MATVRSLHEEILKREAENGRQIEKLQEAAEK